MSRAAIRWSWGGLAVALVGVAWCAWAAWSSSSWPWVVWNLVLLGFNVYFALYHVRFLRRELLPYALGLGLGDWRVVLLPAIGDEPRWGYRSWRSGSVSVFLVGREFNLHYPPRHAERVMGVLRAACMLAWLGIYLLLVMGAVCWLWVLGWLL